MVSFAARKRAAVALLELTGVLDSKVSWAVYDSLGQLIVARRGVLYRYTLSDLWAGKPSSVFDLEHLEKPRGQGVAASDGQE